MKNKTQIRSTKVTKKDEVKNMAGAGFSLAICSMITVTIGKVITTGIGCISKN